MPSIPLSLACIALCAALAVAAAAKPVPQASEAARRQADIVYTSASADVDLKNDSGVFRDIVVTQGGIKVEANEAQASGLHFENSHWTFSGNVRIHVEDRGNLKSDQAVVDFRDKLMTKATITGNPAEFEQAGPDAKLSAAHGHAGEIVYDVAEGTVRLSKDPWLTDGHNEITAPLLIYNLHDQHVTATPAPGAEQRVHMTIVPRPAAPKPAAPTPSAAPDQKP